MKHAAGVRTQRQIAAGRQRNPCNRYRMTTMAPYLGGAGFTVGRGGNYFLP